MITVNSLSKKIKDDKDILRIFLTNRKEYQDILKSDEYQVSDEIVKYLENYTVSSENTYQQNRFMCLKKYEIFCEEERDNVQKEQKKQKIEDLKHHIMESGDMPLEIHTFTDRFVSVIDVDILDVFLIDQELYQKIVLSNKIWIHPNIVEFLDRYKIQSKYFMDKKAQYVSKGSAYLLDRKIHEFDQEILESGTSVQVRQINSITDKVSDETDMDILDIFMNHKNLFKMIRKSKKYKLAPILEEFLMKYSSGKLQPKNYYIEKYDEYKKIKSGKYNVVGYVKITKLTDVISIENKDILTLFLQDRSTYNTVCHMKNYDIDQDIQQFLSFYKPETKKYSKAQKKEYMRAFAEYKKNQETQKNKSLPEKLLENTQEGRIHWKKRKWKKTSQYIEQDLTASYEGHEYLFSVVGKVTENNKWKANMSLEIDGRKHEDFIDNKYRELLYHEILQNIKKEEVQKEKQIFREIHQIMSNDFVVRTNIFKCISESHHLEEVLGIIQVLKANGTMITERVTAAYCSDCGCYFLMQSEYDRISQIGILICKMIEKEDLYRYGLHYHNMAGESILMQNGYNVKANNGLTDIQRQTFLANLIDDHTLTASEIISYLQMFMAQKKGLPSYQMAVDKWDADLQFVRQYKEDNKRRVFINSITKVAYKRK